MVTKTTDFPIPIELETYAGEKALKLQLDDSAVIRDLIISLILLRENLIDNLILSFTNRSVSLKVSQKKSSINSTSTEKFFKLSITLYSLEYFIFFFLKYYRDGKAEANHIDLEFYFENNSIFTWIIKVAEFNEISGEDLIKLLGL